MISRLPHAFWWGGADFVAATHAGVEVRVSPRGTITFGQVGFEVTAISGTAPNGAFQQSRGGLVRGDGLVVESVLNTNAGLEQSWTFSRAPSQNPIVIQVAVRGARLREQREGDLIFDVIGQPGAVRYSHATWVDADSRSWTVPATVRDGNIELTVPPDVIAASRFPATLDPTISPELPVDGPGTLHSQQQFEEWPAVAFNGSIYLVAWRAEGPTSGSEHIEAARVSATGELLDATPLHFAWGFGVRPPAVASNGENFLLVWNASSTWIYAAVVAADGSLVHSQAFTAGTTQFILGAGGISPVVASSGDGFLVAWINQYPNASSTGDIQGVRLTGFGDFVDSAPIQITGASPGRTEIAAGTSPNGYVIVAGGQGASDGGVITASFVPRTGVVQSTGGSVTIADSVSAKSEVTVASTPQAIFVAWNDGRLDPAGDIYGTWMFFDGGVQSANGAPLATGSAAQDSPVAAPFPNGAVVSYGEHPSSGDVVKTVVIDTAGVAGPTANVSTGAREPSIACGGSDCLIAWIQSGSDGGGTDVYANLFAPISGLSAVDGGLHLSQEAAEYDRPHALACRNGLCLAAWVESVGVYPQNNCTVRATRIDADGGILDQPPLTLADAGWRFPGEVAVATNGTDFIVGWTQDSTVNVVSVAADAGSSQSRPLQWGGSAAESLSISPFGDGYLAAWHQGNPDNKVVAVRLNDALVAAPPGVLLLGSQASAPVATASHGSSALVTWQDFYKTQLRTLALDGGVAQNQFSNVSGYSSMRLIPTESSYLAYYGGSFVRRAWLDFDGGVLSGDTDFHNFESFPSADFDGTQLIFASQKLGQFAISRYADGGWLDPTPLGITAGAARYRGDVRLGSPLPNRAILTYLADSRLYARVIDLNASGLGTPCSSAADCSSGFCVSGVCCDSACDHGCGTCAHRAGAVADGVCSPVARNSRKCRFSAGACDTEEWCDGQSPECPNDVLRDAGALCWSGASTCDPAKVCDGLSAMCPARTPADAGTPCDDGNLCTTNEVCQAGGACFGTWRVCEAANECRYTTWCVAADGGCPPPIHLPYGYPCDGGYCSSGVCVPGVFDAGTPDAGTPDAGPPDAGAPDAATPDAGTADAGTRDAGSLDAGAADSGTADAGVSDGGTGGADVDGGTEDSGVLDGGSACDAVGCDAGQLVIEDAGTDGGAPGIDDGEAEPHPFEPAGCGCNSTAVPGWLAFWMLSVVVMRRRRER